jgi:hypothetical protein
MHINSLLIVDCSLQVAIIYKLCLIPLQFITPVCRPDTNLQLHIKSVTVSDVPYMSNL